MGFRSWSPSLPRDVDDDMAGRRDHRPVAGMDQRGRIRLLDHGGTDDLGPGGKRRPPQDARRRPAASASSKTTSRDAPRRRGASGVHGSASQRRRSCPACAAGDDKAQVDDLDRLRRARPGRSAVRARVEARAHGVGVAASASCGPRDRDRRWCVPGRHSADRQRSRNRPLGAMPSRAIAPAPASASSAKRASPRLARRARPIRRSGAHEILPP